MTNPERESRSTGIGDLDREPPRVPGRASPRGDRGDGRRRLARESRARLGAGTEVLPKHVTAETLKAVIKGLDFLANKQADDGSWIVGGGEGYPVAMTGLAGTAMLAHGNSPTRGKYSRNLKGAVEFLVRCATPTGLITGPTQDSGQPMHGHGFVLHVSRLRLWDDHQGIVAAAGAKHDPQSGDIDQPRPERSTAAGRIFPAPATKVR